MLVEQVEAAVAVVVEVAGIAGGRRGPRSDWSGFAAKRQLSHASPTAVLVAIVLIVGIEGQLSQSFAIPSPSKVVRRKQLIGVRDRRARVADVGDAVAVVVRAPGWLL